jgi:hypothetical protein
MTGLSIGLSARSDASEVALWRLYLLRATYLLIVVGQGIQTWPQILHHDKPWTVMQSAALCMLAALTVLSALGLRYPLKLLPVFFFEIVWKTLWLLVMALPLWQAGKLDPNTMQTVIACAMVIIFPIVIPWGYVMTHYVRAAADRWR